MGPIEARIQQKLTKALSPDKLEIENDSAKHAGHAAMRGNTTGETHFTVRCVSSAFESLPIIKRHRLVHAALQDEFANGLHALVLVTKTPKEVEALDKLEDAPQPSMPVRKDAKDL